MSIDKLGNNTGMLLVTDLSANIIWAHKNDSNGAKAVTMLAAQSKWMIPEYELINNGSIPSNLFDSLSGVKIYLDSSISAVPNPPTYSTSTNEITKYLAVVGINNALAGFDKAISAGSVSITRSLAISVALIDTEASAGTDDLDTITYQNVMPNDILIIRNKNAVHTVVVRDKTVGGGNINTRGNQSATLNGNGTSIMLVWDGTEWFEITREEDVVLPTLTQLRANSVPQGSPGVSTTTIPAGGGTKTLTPGTDLLHQIFKGTTTLTASYTIQGGVGITGDSFLVEIGSGITLGANSLTVFGVSVTAEEALNGGVLVMGWTVDGTTWTGRKLFESSAQQWLQTAMIKDAAVTAAKIASGAIDSSKLDGTTVSPPIPFGVAISGTQILSLNSSPIEIIPAPGASQVIDIIECAVVYNFVTAAFATNTSLEVMTSGATVEQFYDDSIIAQAATKKRKMIPASPTTSTDQLILGANVVAKVKTGNPTAGDGNIYIFGTYRIVTLP